MSKEADRTAHAVGARWKPYLEYKQSGVEWLGEIPANWDARPLKALAPFVSRGNGPDYVNDSRISVINQACIYWDGLHLESVKYQEEVDVSGWKGLLHDGDLLLNSTGTGTLGRAALFEGHQGTSIADSHVTIVRLSTSDMSPQYAFYLVQTPLYQGYIYAALVSGSTNQLELSREKLRATPVVVPSLPEQRAIGEFLDRETGKIDALIAKKERLIDLLQEKRTALISQAVTKGLDPSVPMKDSGIEWLGEIPAHWRLKRLRFACHVNPHKSEIRPIPSDKEVTFLPMELIGENGSITLDETRLIEDVYNHGFTYFCDEDVIVAKITPCFENGKGALCRGLLGGIGFGTTELHVLRACEEISAEYLFYLTICHPLRKLGEAEMKGAAGQKRVPDAFLRDFRVALPPLPEQDAIVEFLGDETDRIDTVIAKAHDAIEKLTEYRTAVISAAVTGKIDVREAAS